MVPAATKSLILVVDDDEHILSLIQDLLTAEGYGVKTATSAFQARGTIVKVHPDLIVLDRSLPDGEGVDVMKEIRAEKGFENVPVLFLTAKSSPADKTEGLRSGGDDYLAKPFNHAEFLARVDALLRRMKRPVEPIHTLSGKGIHVDLDRRTVEVHHRHVELSPTEFELLAALMEKNGRVLTRRFLLERVWGEGMELRMNSKSVDVAVGRLREALGPLGEKIVAVQSIGYRFDLEE